MANEQPVAVVVGVGAGLGAAIADTYWHLAHQDPSAWTQELDAAFLQGEILTMEQL